MDESLLTIENNASISSSGNTMTMGKKKVLAIRANAIDTSTSMDIKTTENRIFGKKNSLKSQYMKCSSKQLKLSPYKGISETGVAIQNGVGEITININVKGKRSDYVDDAMVDAASKKYGNLSAQFDHVIFCMPPGTGDWLAYANINSWKSVYNDKWCDNLSTLQHEIGHNLNLGHSGEGNSAYGYYMYGDESCPMGFGSYNTHLSEDGIDRPRCFNGAKSWQLGWYTKGHVVVKPSSPTFKGNLIGLVHYKKLQADKVLVRIEGQEKDYYVAFNHKAMYNKLTLEGADLVLITSKEGDTSSNDDSNLEVRLDKGDSYVIEGTYTVKVLEINKSSKKRFYAKIIIDVDECTSNSDCKDDIDPCIIGTCSAKGYCIRKQDCSKCDKKPIFVEVVTDNYPEKTSWNIKNNKNQIVVENDFFKDKFAMYNKRVCLGKGSYKFIMNTPGQEICCPITREGYFALSVDDKLLKQDILSKGSKYERSFSI